MAAEQHQVNKEINNMKKLPTNLYTIGGVS